MVTHFKSFNHVRKKNALRTLLYTTQLSCTFTQINLNISYNHTREHARIQKTKHLNALKRISTRFFFKLPLSMHFNSRKRILNALIAYPTQKCTYFSNTRMFQMQTLSYLHDHYCRPLYSLASSYIFLPTVKRTDLHVDFVSATISFILVHAHLSWTRSVARYLFSFCCFWSQFVCAPEIACLELSFWTCFSSFVFLLFPLCWCSSWFRVCFFVFSFFLPRLHCERCCFCCLFLNVCSVWRTF